ncbi:lysosomal aspartic protease-like isoform X2 [Camponotus floridanus]|uniref:lysosomal aspartic protease-like isoform X2 n=1 Tax=Camponotus floridanus TaxID=104421 RepID=UPI000DC67BF8|nr:lysosomal aspartic protease-like isoform X2 [Camponotus floridanus]
MFRLLVMVMVFFATTDAQFLNPEFLWIWRGITNTKLQKVHNISSVRLTNIDNVIYYGIINIGIPPQEVKVVFDTSSEYLRIFPKNFSTNPVALARSQNTSFNPYIVDNRLFHVGYLDYNVTGFLSRGTVNVANLNVERQTFLEVVNISEEYTDELGWYSNIYDRKFDGLLGLSCYNIPVGEIKPVFYNMIQQKLVSSGIFSFYLNRNASADLGGKLIFGGSDPAYYEGDFTYIPVTNRKYWQFTIDSIEMTYVMSSNFILCKKSCQAIVDTSIWKIIGPEKDVLLIDRLTRTNPYGRVDCNIIPHLPIIRFNLRGFNFDVKTFVFTASI